MNTVLISKPYNRDSDSHGLPPLRSAINLNRITHAHHSAVPPTMPRHTADVSTRHRIPHTGSASPTPVPSCKAGPLMQNVSWLDSLWSLLTSIPSSLFPAAATNTPSQVSAATPKPRSSRKQKPERRSTICSSCPSTAPSTPSSARMTSGSGPRCLFRRALALTTLALIALPAIAAAAGADPAVLNRRGEALDAPAAVPVAVPPAGVVDAPASPPAGAGADAPAKPAVPAVPAAAAPAKPAAGDAAAAAPAKPDGNTNRADPALPSHPPLTPEQLHDVELRQIALELGIPDLSQLNAEQRARLEERLKFRHEHSGHEKQHAQMAMILMGGLVAFQFVLLFWKKAHPKSFQLASLVGLWLVPPAIGFSAGNTRYILVWLAFSVANAFVVRKALFETPMQSSTPKLVYRWYSYVYKGSVAVGGLGYFFVVATFFRLPFALGASEQTEMAMFKAGIVMLFYGLYFGTLGRDFVDRLSDRMAIRTGYFSRTGFPKKHLRPNVCAICGDSTDLGRTHAAGESSKLHKLACDHTYHEECIRGWTIVGKKDCCPYCKEKVDLKAFSRHAWDTTQILYLNLLDALRYLIVWNPILFLTIHLVFNVLGYD
ncbi:hypothetical protein HDU96_006535 [Phlyctochytrium bullatum]|nr:hypothetical protein HDU96_006535 [Phlyctochytrium bullatum]